jgi:hypothetical protein
MTSGMITAVCVLTALGLGVLVYSILFVPKD